MKKIIIIILAIALIGAAVMGVDYFKNALKPTLNSNEKIVSTSIDEKGAPKDILGDITKIQVTREQGEAYVSIKVNDKGFKKCRVTVKFKDSIIDDRTIKVSDSRYVSYHFEDLKDMKPGVYQLAFYDKNDEINVYAALELK